MFQHSGLGGSRSIKCFDVDYNKIISYGKLTCLFTHNLRLETLTKTIFSIDFVTKTALQYCFKHFSAGIFMYLKLVLKYVFILKTEVVELMDVASLENLD